MSQLRYELTTDKPFKQLTDTGSDAHMWNEALEKLILQIGKENCTWFKGPWLYAECYMYRRIREAMLLCSSEVRSYDPFEESKIESHALSNKSTFGLISALCPLNYDDEKTNEELAKRRFGIIVEALLWANKNDLSLSSGNDVSAKVSDLIDLLDSFKENILCDHTEQLWSFFLKLKSSSRSELDEKRRIVIILDNCSIELAADLILCDYLLRNDFVDEIKLHGKAFSWFISDVTQVEFDYLLRQFCSVNSLTINNFHQRIRQYISDAKLIVDCTHMFWTSPYAFTEMQTVAPDLYADLKQSALVLMKGDLNYRKLLADLGWPFDTPLSVAVQHFKPTSLCAIRTLKSDLVANLDLNEQTNKNYALLQRKYPDSNKWLVTGDYGIIQFVE